MRVAYVLPFVLAAACAQATSGPPPEHVDVPAQPPQTQSVPTYAPEEPERPPMDLRVKEEDDTPGPLSGAWAATFNHTAKYAAAAASMHAARGDYVNAAAPLFTSDGGLPSAQEFQKANAALELLSRRYAAVYYAPDANDMQRIDTLEEAANVLLRWSKRLDEVGLAQVPASFRTNGAIALTFEDVVHGPAKRWRGEGITLASTCQARAKAGSVNTYAARSCADLVKTYAHIAQPPHAKSQPECACVPGDPLCSASMSGWCRPSK